MKREGFWRDVTPPLNIYGVPLPFTMIYLLLFPYPSKQHSGCAAAFCCFCAPGYSGWTVRTLCRRLYSLGCRVNRRQAVPVVPASHRITP